MSDGPIAAVMVHVPSWQEGLRWYRQAFPDAQTRSFADQDWTCLECQGVAIELVNADGKVAAGAAGSVVYWVTSDFDARLAYLLGIGATLFRGPITIEGNARICQVRDPFGNSIGVRERAQDSPASE